MEVIKCDRCGFIYSKKERLEIYNNYPNVYVNTEDGTQLLELCKNCSIALKDWVVNVGPLYKFLDKVEKQEKINNEAIEKIHTISDPFEEGGL